MSRRTGGGFSPRLLLLLVAVVCFVVVASGTITIAGMSLLAIGFAAFAASFIFP